MLSTPSSAWTLQVSCFNYSMKCGDDDSICFTALSSLHAGEANTAEHHPNAAFIISATRLCSSVEQMWNH